MRRFLILLFCFAILINGCDDKNNKNLNTSKEQEKDILASSFDNSENSGLIIYGRYGEEREICSVNPTGKKFMEIYKGDYEKATGYEDKIIFYSKNENERGIYLANIGEKKSGLIIDGFRLTQKPCFSRDGSIIAFYAYPKYDSKEKDQYKQRLYYMYLSEKEPVRIKNAEGQIKHLSFIDNESIIYSKFIKEKGTYQICKYSIKEGNETLLLQSDYNDVNPVVSPDGTKIAFLSDKYSNYNLFLLNLADNTIQDLDSNDAVVGESVIWSPDGTKIVYVTLSGAAKYSLKLADLNQNANIFIGNGYIAAFSPSGKSIVYAEYEISTENKLEKNQTIYKMNIEDKEKVKVWKFPEKSVFSRSINMLYWTNSLDMK